MVLTKRELNTISKHLPDFYIVGEKGTDHLKNCDSSFFNAIGYIVREMKEEEMDDAMRTAFSQQERADVKKKKIMKMHGDGLLDNEKMKKIGKFALQAAPVLLSLLI